MVLCGKECGKIEIDVNFFFIVANTVICCFQVVVKLNASLLPILISSFLTPP
jgi:hypothetical protein